MDSRIGKVVADCADEVTMALTWLALLLLCAPFEVYASLMRFARSLRRMIARGRPGLGGPLRPISR